MPATPLENLKKAVRSLEDALVPPPANDRERDGAIQRFEYTFELCWKTAGKSLEAQGMATTSPKNIIRLMAKVGWVTDPAIWVSFLEGRNETAHIYHENIANKVFALAVLFLPEAKKLLAQLEKANAT